MAQLIVSEGLDGGPKAAGLLALERNWRSSLVRTGMIRRKGLGAVVRS